MPPRAALAEPLKRISVISRCRRLFTEPVPWPSLSEEFGDYSRYFKGTVLNAGAGDRDLSPFIEGQLYNQDLPHGRHNRNIDIEAPLHSIPVPDEFFDAVICNAVLEHVQNPTEIMREFYRVLRRGGSLYLAVPFMQPEHLDPTDFQRYTEDGLNKLVHDHRFKVLKSEGLHTVYHTLVWVTAEWLRAKRTLPYLLLGLVLLPVLRSRCRHSRTFVHSLASGYRVLATKV